MVGFFMHVPFQHKEGKLNSILKREGTSYTLNGDRMEYVVEVKGLKKSYKQQCVLHGIDFQIKQGEFFALLGPNGAGKSTTISILCGLLKKDEGEVYLQGKSVDDHPQNIAKGVGVVFQNHCMDELLSGYENLILRCGFYGLSKKAAKKRVKELSELCELTSFLHQKCATLSGGQKRRLDIARALIPSPVLLILDEPTTGLDPVSRTHIWEMIQSLRHKHGMSILLTTHYLDEVKDADTICMLLRGKIALYGSLQQIHKEYIKDYLYLYSDQLEPMARILNNRKLLFERRNNALCVAIQSTRQTLSILQACAMSLSRFEVISGSLEDVYIKLLEGESK